MRTVLPNGLTLIVQPSHSSPVVALQVWVRVGSADEGASQQGLAHLHEHMLFKGTRSRGVGEIAAAVEASGGDINAWTSYDQTVYHVVLAARYLDQGLEILADALLRSTFDEEALATEIQVVADEIRRGRDMPQRMLSEQLFRTAYQTHPYRRPIVGELGALQATRRDAVLEFYRRWYTPGNMVLVMVGDLDPEEALARASALFGGASGATPAPAQRPQEPPQDGLRVQLSSDAISESHLGLAFPIPALRHEDIPALDLISVLLGQGESARLELQVRRRREAATDVYCYAYTPRDPGLFVLGAATPQDQTAAALEALLEEALRLTEEPVAPDELERARRIVETDLVYLKETVQGTARRLGFYEAVAGDLGFEARYHQRLAEIDRQAILEVARRYFRTDRLSVAAIQPRCESGSLCPGGLDEAGVARIVERAKLAVAQRFTPVVLPEPQQGIRRIRFEDGPTLLIQEDHTVPLVALRAVYLGGMRAETAESQGVGNLLARLMTRGTRTRSGEDLARRFDSIGGSISGFSGRNSFGLKAEFLSSEIEEGLELVSDCLLNPALNQEEMAREKALVLEELQAQGDNPAALAFQAFVEALFGDHPYRFDPLGDPETVAGLERPDLLNHFESRYGPAGLTLAIVGDVDSAFVAQEVRRLFVDPAAEVPEELPPMAWDPPTEPQTVVQYRARQQAHLVLGFPGVEVDHPDRFPLEILATVLSGQGGRLFVELRDKRGMAYSIGAVTLEGIDPGYVSIYLATAPERADEAVAALLEQLELLRRDGITAEELQRAKTYLLGNQAIGLQRSAERAGTLAFNELYGLGFDAHLRYPQQIEAVTLADVKRAATKHFQLDRYTLAVVKPSAEAETLRPERID